MPFYYYKMPFCYYVVTSFTASGAPAGDHKRDRFVGFVVYLFDHDELIYSRMYNFSARTVEVEVDEEPENTIEQKHWDKLVYKVMKDYMERLQ